ncbi:MAG: hypothetical protein ABI763_04590 [Bacteroidota bacterium]
MGISLEDKHLIDRYLQGEVSGIEMENFSRRLEADAIFKHEVEVQQIIYSGIQKASKDKLQNLIIDSLDYRKPRVPFALKMIITFLAVTGVGITLWFYVGNEGAKDSQARSWFAFLKSKKNTEEVKQEIQKQKPETRQKIAANSDSLVQQNQVVQKGDTGEKANMTEPDSVAPSIAEEEIIVKQDQLLVSANILIENKDEEKDTEKNKTLTDEAVQLLNPGADLPEVEKPAASYQVEFWVSPINYKGYKMSKNKLILFGIDEPEAVKLYRVNNGLFMSYLKEYYHLNDSFDFVSYQKLKDSEIPLAIR